MFRVFAFLTLIASMNDVASAQEKLPLEFLKMEKVYERSQDPHEGEMMFSSDDKSLLISEVKGPRLFRGWTRYSLENESHSEYNYFYSVEKLGPPLVNTIPSGYDYHHIAQEQAYLISEAAGRLYFQIVKSGMVVSTDLNLQDVKPVARLDANSSVSYFDDSHSGARAYNGQRIYDAGNMSTSKLFLFDSAMQPVPLLSQKNFRDNADEVIAANSTLQVAVKKDLQFALLTAGGKLPLKPELLQITPEDDRRYGTAFFANDDSWLCVVLNGIDNHLPQLVWYDTKTQNKLGTFEFPGSFQVHRKLDKKVGSDKSGKLVVVTADRAAAILRVRDEHFELLADHSHLPRLALLHNPAVQFAVSHDGQIIALDVNANPFRFPDITQKGKALIRIRDVERLRSSAIIPK